MYFISAVYGMLNIDKLFYIDSSLTVNECINLMIARWNIQAIRAFIQNGRSAVAVNYALRKPNLLKAISLENSLLRSFEFERFNQLISVLISARINCLKRGL